MLLQLLYIEHVRVYLVNVTPATYIKHVRVYLSKCYFSYCRTRTKYVRTT